MLLPVESGISDEREIVANRRKVTSEAADARRAVNRMIAAAGKRAGLEAVHPHMLRHSCGFALANKGTDFRTIQDLLGHRDPRQYTRVAARRFEGVWD